MCILEHIFVRNDGNVEFPKFLVGYLPVFSDNYATILKSTPLDVCHVPVLLMNFLGKFHSCLKEN